MCLLTNLYIKHIVSPGNAHMLQTLHYDIKLDIAGRSNVFKCRHLCSQLPAQGQWNSFPENTNPVQMTTYHTTPQVMQITGPYVTEIEWGTALELLDHLTHNHQIMSSSLDSSPFCWFFD